MATVVPKLFRCGHCGRHSEHLVLDRANRMDNSDLDMRPGGELRHTMAYWIHRCRDCTYCAPDISKYVHPQDLESAAYSSAVHDRSVPQLARHFLAAAVLLEAGPLASVERAAAFRLAAAWICDDIAAGETDEQSGAPEDAANAAVACRRAAAISVADVLRQTVHADGETAGAQVIVLVDTLRRTGQFAEAEAIWRQHLTLRPHLAAETERVLEFERTLIAERDSGPHNGAECDAFARRGVYQADALVMRDHSDFSTLVTPESWNPRAFLRPSILFRSRSERGTGAQLQ